MVPFPHPLYLSCLWEAPSASGVRLPVSDILTKKTHHGAPVAFLLVGSRSSQVDNRINYHKEKRHTTKKRRDTGNPNKAWLGDPGLRVNLHVPSVVGVAMGAEQQGSHKEQRAPLGPDAESRP